jgi:Leucine-rich repeat (LRR) protein
MTPHVRSTSSVALSLLAALAALADGAGAQAPTNASPSGQCVGVPASTVVTFADANLAAAVRSALALAEGAPLTCGQVATLTELEASAAGIGNLSGIESLTGLTRLDLGENSISDLSPLAGLTGLASVWLGDNSIRDVTPLSTLTGLTFLGLRGNQIVDIGPLGTLSQMVDLNITYNEISDLSALRSMTELTTLRLYNNPIADIGALEGLTKLHEVHIHDLPTLSNVQPLLDNPGVGEGDQFPLFNSGISCRDVSALRAKGVSVGGTCLAQTIGPGGWAALAILTAGVAGGWAYRRRARSHA